MQFHSRDSTILHLAHQLSEGPHPPVVRPWPNIPLVLVLNKQDKIDRDLRPTVLQQLTAVLQDTAKFDKVFHVSALLGQGIGTVRQYLLSRVSGMEVHSLSQPFVRPSTALLLCPTTTVYGTCLKLVVHLLPPQTALTV